MFFPISSVETPIWLPPLVAFGISIFTSMAGVSGAFLLLPFQVSVLGYTSPSVSATNQVFNVVAIPSGIYRYIREGRMVWPLTWVVIIGTLPGVIIGAWVRIVYLPDPGHFKFFVGLVLLYIGSRLAWGAWRGRGGATFTRKDRPSGVPASSKVTATYFSLKHVRYRFDGEIYSFSPVSVFLLCIIIGVVGGIYGIGGGSIVAPFFVIIFKMPVYTVAGAALMGTFITSVAGVFIYQILALYLNTQTAVAPDWLLGALFGVGGFFGMYFGARCQKYVPAHFIEFLLSACILFVALSYIGGFFI